MIYKRRPISESAVNSLSKVFENSLRKQITNRSKEKWGAKWKAESQRVLGLSKQIKDLSYGGIIHAIKQWNDLFENEPIVPHDFVKRIDLFRIVRVLSAHLKQEYNTELAAYRSSWKRDYDRFENDLIYAMDSALYMMKQQTISGDGSRAFTTIGEHASMILEALGEIISMLNEKEFKDARRDLNRVTKAAKAFFEESPEKFAKIIKMENQAIIELLTNTEKVLPEGDANRLGCREWSERLKKDTAVVADPMGVLSFIMRIALMRTMMKNGISNRVLELLERIIGRFTGEPETSLSESSESLSDRIPTGSESLDNLLLGGIPETYTVALTSLACDERDSLIERYLELGTKRDQIIFYVATNVSERLLALAKTSSNFLLFVCNPQAETIVKDLPNAIKLKGVENLNDFNMALTSAFRKLDTSPKKPRRACIEIVSDVLLQ
ncbi:hypothetical protein GTO27_01605, partial [Candidatus Bathyarchaeota archaeon]|nr:hypothetical protein [Candidatus Bathyarchaeota archaeon]